MNELKGRSPRIEQLEQRQLLSIGGTIGGTVFEDVDRDGAYDIDERGLAGWTVELQRLGEDGGDRVHTFAGPAETRNISDGFGSSVAALGQNIVVGVPRADYVGVTEDAGVVHVFDSVTGKLRGTFDNPVVAKDPALAAGDLFGHSVVAMGENVLVSAPQADTAGENAGAAYLFDGASGKLLQTFTNPTPEAFDGFGWSMAVLDDSVLDDYVLIGAPFDNMDTDTVNTGAVHVFSATTGKLEATISNPTPEAWERFGYSLATIGDAIVVGAPYDNAGADSAGAAYLFECDAATGEWTTSATYLSPTASPHDMFGYSVAAVDRQVAIGSPGDDTATLNAGAAYLFDAHGEVPTKTFLSPAPGASNGFGWCVAGTHDDNLLISAPWNDAAGHDAGAVFLFDGAFDGATDAPLRTFANPTGVPDAFGTSVAVIGERVIVGAKDTDAGAYNAGAVHMFGTDTIRMTTNPLGLYAFTDLPAGTYEVREIMPTGRRYEQTFPGGDGAYTVELGENQVAHAMNFGNYKTALLDDTADDPDVVPSDQQPLPYNSLGWPEDDGSAFWDDPNEPVADTPDPGVDAAALLESLFGSGGGAMAGDGGEAPRVIGVTVDNTDPLKLHPEYSFPAQSDSCVQLHTVPIGGGINTVTITFDQSVAGVTAGVLSITDRITSTTYDPTGVEYVGDAATWQWTFTTPLTDGEMVLTLSDSVNAGGVALDGEWASPRHFCDTVGNGNFDDGSGNGEAEGNFTFNFTLLPGDASQDGIVNDVDLDILYDHWYQHPEGDALWTDADFDGDGDVDLTDLDTLGIHFYSQTGYWQSSLYTLIGMYENVVNTIEFEPYRGAMKSPEAVLQTGSGNSWDTAALLVDMYAEEGITTDPEDEQYIQYVTGRINVPIDEAMAYVGVTDPQAAEDVLDAAGLDADQVGDEIVFDHAWLEGVIDTVWVKLDPSWKFQDHGPEVLNMLGPVPFDETGYFSQTRKEPPNEYYEAQVREYLAENDPGVSIADVPYAGPILVQSIDVLPIGLPYTVESSSDAVSTIPEGDTHRIRASLGDGQGTTYFTSVILSLPTMGRMPLTVRPTATGPGEQVTPELLLNWQTDSELSGELLAYSNPVALDKTAGVVLTIEHFNPDGDATPDSESEYDNREAGEYMAIAIDANQVSGDMVLDQQRLLNEATIDYANGVIPSDMDTHIGGLLYLAGLKYVHDTGAAEDVVRGLTAAVPIRNHVASAVLTADTTWQEVEDLPYRLPDGIGIDVQNGYWGSVSIDGSSDHDAARSSLLGHVNSEMEHVVWDDLTAGGYTNGDPQWTPVEPDTVEFLTQTYAGSINVADGNVQHDMIDIVLPGLGFPLAFSRHYDSRCADVADSDRGLGKGWSFMYSDRLEFNPDDSITWFTGSGDRLTFESDAGVYVTPDSIHGTLTFNGTGLGYTWEDKTGSEIEFDDDGKLLEMADRYGNGVEVSYDVGNPDRIDYVDEFVADPLDTPRRLDFTYNANGHITTIDTVIDGVLDRTWYYYYHQQGYLWAVVSPYDSQTPLAVPEYYYYTDDTRAGLLSRVVDYPSDNTTNFTYYANRRGFEVIDAEGSARSLWYNLYRNRTAWTDPLGAATSFTYNARGNVEEVLLADRTTVATTWEDSLPTSITDAFGQTETYEFDNGGNLTFFANRLGDSFNTYQYSDDFANLTVGTEIVRPDDSAAFDFDDYTISNYDADYGGTATVEDEGYTLHLEGDALKKIQFDSTYTVTSDTVLEFDFRAPTEGYCHHIGLDDDNIGSWDKLFRLYGTWTTGIGDYNDYEASAPEWKHYAISVGNSYTGDMDYLCFINYGSATESYFRDVRLYEAEEIRTTEYEYYDDGSLEQITDALDNITEFTYDNRGLPETVTTPRGTATSDPTDDFMTTFTYNPAGQVESMVTWVAPDEDPEEPDVTVTQYFGYDNRGNLTSATDPLGGYAGDPAHITTYTHDLLGRILKQTLPDPDGAENPLPAPWTEFVYSPRGELLSMTDHTERTTSFEYDAVGRLIETTNPDDGVRTNAFDPAGNLVAMTDELGRVARFVHDSRGRVTSTILPDGAVARTTYDGGSRVLRSTDPLGNTAEYRYDVLGRLTQQTLPDPDGPAGELPAQVARYGYNAAGNLADVTNTVVRPGMTAQWLLDRDGATTAVDSSDNGYDGTCLGDATIQNHVLVLDGSGDAVEVTGIPDEDLTGAITISAWFNADDLDNNSYVVAKRNGSAEQQFGLIVWGSSGSRPGAVSFLTYGGGDVHTQNNVISPGEWYHVVVTRAESGQTTIHLNGEDVTEFGNYTTITEADCSLHIGARGQSSYPDGLSHEWDGKIADVQIYDHALTAAERELLSSQTVTHYEYDKLDRLTTKTLPDPDGLGGELISPVTHFGYDADGNLIWTTDPRGSEAEDPDHTTWFQYDGLGRRTHVTDALGGGPGDPGHTVEALYNALGNVIKITDQIGRTVDYEYDALGRLTKKILPEFLDYNNQLVQPITDYKYDDRGNLASVTDPLDNVTRFLYDDFGRRTCVTDALGGYAGDPDHSVVTVYDAVGNVVSVTDQLDRTTGYEYDAMNRLVQKTLPDPDGEGGQDPPEYTYTYDAVGNLLTETDPLDHRTEYVHDNLGRRTHAILPHPDGEIDVTPINNGVAAQDSATGTGFIMYSEESVYARFSANPPHSGNSDHFIAVKYIGGQWHYDNNGNYHVFTPEPTDVLIAEVDFTNDTITGLQGTDDVEHDVARGYLDGDLTFFANQWNGGYEPGEFTVDGTWFKKNGPKTTYTHDAVGNVLAVTDPEQNTTTFEHDRLNRTISETNQLDDACHFEYDPAGNLVRKTDRNERVTEYAYDPLGQMTEERWLDDQLQIVRTTTMQYDAVGRLWSVDDPAATQFYGYDQLGNVTSALVRPHDPDSGSTGHSCGTVIIAQDSLTPENNSVDYFVSLSLGSLVPVSLTSNDFDAYLIVTSPSGKTLEDDNSGEGTNASLEFIAWESGEWTFTVTSLDPSPSGSYMLSWSEGHFLELVEFDYGYDEAGNLRSISDRSDLIGSLNGTTEYAYDPLHRVEWVKQYGDNTSDKRVDFDYNNAGQFDVITRYADLDATETVAASTYSYDGIGRLTGLLHQDGTSPNPVTLADYTWQYDAASRMTQMTSPDGTSNYQHDDTNQLTVANHNGYQTNEGYSYDDNGNRMNTGYATGTNNRLESDGVFNYTYDDEGNRTTRTRISNDPADDYLTEYEWDHRNRLVGVTLKNNAEEVTKAVQYTYDIHNQRLAKIVDEDGDGEPDDYRYNVHRAGSLRLEITDPDGIDNQTNNPRVANRYLFGPAVDQILAVEEFPVFPQGEGDVLWGLADHQGTIRDIVEHDSQSGETTVVNHRKYDSFGRITSQTDETVDFIFGYTGKPLDPDTGLQYNHNRWYDATVGRWLSEDHIPDDTNPYRYVKNGPLTATDPNGLFRDPGIRPPPSKSEDNTGFVGHTYFFARTLATYIIPRNTGKLPNGSGLDDDRHGDLNHGFLGDTKVYDSTDWFSLGTVVGNYKEVVDARNNMLDREIDKIVGEISTKEGSSKTFINNNNWETVRLNGDNGISFWLGTGEMSYAGSVTATWKTDAANITNVKLTVDSVWSWRDIIDARDDLPGFVGWIEGQCDQIMEQILGCSYYAYYHWDYDAVLYRPIHLPSTGGQNND
jgi:RHS repeat-associated protein